MRTTIRINDRLLAEAKKIAAERGTTLTAVVEDSLRESLARSKTPHRHKPFRIKPFRGGGLQPGVDLDDSASLLDIMEGRSGSG
jgi:Bacterial antitoxin of type II TA system, VapB